MYFNAGKPVSEYKANVVAAPYRLSTEWRYAPPRNMRRYLRGKYDVSGLPPMPTHLMPLVMPEHCKTQTPTKVCEQEPEEEHYDSSDDEWPLASREKTTKKRTNWADICESDVEDDEF